MYIVRKLMLCINGGIFITCAVMVLNMSIQNRKHTSITNRDTQSTVDQNIDEQHFPIIYFITPTYARPTQIADLTRLVQTLYSIKRLTWILVEDSKNKTQLVTKFLAKYNINSVHLNAKTLVGAVHRGLNQRNAALYWIRRNHVVGRDKALIYFGDDDNSYAWLLFEEMRKTKQVGVLPVGLSGAMDPGGKPIVKNGKVVSFLGWNTKNRKFALDMAGFVFNADLLFKYPTLRFIKGKPGFLETNFLQQFVNIQDMEPLANNCTQYYVWHVKTDWVKG